MRPQPLLLLGLAAAALAAPATAQTRPPRPAPHTAHPPAIAPKAIGKFEDWTAATHQEAGQTVCYAFTRASASTPAIAGRGDVVLTVTQRPGGTRDAVALSAGFAYAANAEVSVQVEQASLPFYTAQRSAFSRDGHAAITALERGRQAVAKSPGPRNTAVTDTFSLRGFAPAYAAMNKACPPLKAG
jgi:hypothetical protein